jgi:hypothetical protein
LTRVGKDRKHSESTMGSSFNPSEAVTFDLQFGHIHLDGAPTRVMVAADALVSLCQAAGEEETAALGHSIGSAAGRRVAVRLGSATSDRHEAVRETSFEEVINHLAGELAIVGLGSLSAERWGKALVLIVDQSPLGDGGDALLGEVLQAALLALTDQAVRVLKVQRVGVRARFLALSGAVVDSVNERLRKGENWFALVASLHHGAEPS